MNPLVEIVHYSAVASIFWSIFCRARKMNKRTPGLIKLQHQVVLVAAFLSLFFMPLIGVAFCVFLAVDSIRWKYGVPDSQLEAEASRQFRDSVFGAKIEID
jgi:hypothetical protein